MNKLNTSFAIWFNLLNFFKLSTFLICRICYALSNAELVCTLTENQIELL